MSVMDHHRRRWWFSVLNEHCRRCWLYVAACRSSTRHVAERAKSRYGNNVLSGKRKREKRERERQTEIKRDCDREGEIAGEKRRGTRQGNERAQY